MYNNNILNNARELGKGELIQLKNALDKWYPALIQTYNTSILDMMSNPYKKGLIHAIIIIFIVIIGITVNSTLHLFKPLDFSYKNRLKSPFIYIVLLVICVGVFGSTAYAQYKTNENLTLIMTLTKPGATKYDYESSNVIRSKLMRNAYGKGSDSGVGSGLAGGLLGYGMGSSRRKIGGFGRRR